MQRKQFIDWLKSTIFQDWKKKPKSTLFYWVIITRVVNGIKSPIEYLIKNMKIQKIKLKKIKEVKL